MVSSPRVVKQSFDPLDVFGSISNLVENQFPAFYQEEGPNFIAFVKAYYEWLEEQQTLANGTIVDNALYDARNIVKLRDIDTTLDQFFTHFINKYLNGFPQVLLGNKKLLEKHILEIYRSKGSVNGVKFLFRLLYNEDPNIYIPGNDVLRLSDGKWIQRKYLEVTDAENNNSLINKQIIGTSSGAKAFVDNFEQINLNAIGKIVNLLYLSNIEGEFVPGDIVYPVDTPLILTETALQNITQGTGDVGLQVTYPTVYGSPKYFQILQPTPLSTQDAPTPYQTNGDIMVATTGSGVGLKYAIKSTYNAEASNGAIAFIIPSTETPYGDGYITGAGYTRNPTITITTGANTSGYGANIAGITLVNVEKRRLNIDYILPEVDYLISATDYGPSLGYANVNTIIDDVFNYRIYDVGNIGGFNGINPGHHYDNYVNTVIFDPLVAGYNFADSNGYFMGADAVVQSPVTLATGIPDNIRIVDSGFGYNTDGEEIVLFNDTYAQTHIGDTTIYEGKIRGTIILGGIGVKEGYWENTQGHINSDKYIHDNYYYQEYSYEIQINKSLDKYISVLKDVMHPAGNEVFGKVRISYSAPKVIAALASQLTQA